MIFVDQTRKTKAKLHENNECEMLNMVILHEVVRNIDNC